MSKWRLSTLLLLGYLGAADASFTVSCDDGCSTAPAIDRTANLLVIRDDAASITLKWQTGLTPNPERPFLLIAGNPIESDTLVNLGILDFAQEDGQWTATRAFPVSEIGHDTFIAALLRQGREPSEIADWTAFRVKRESEIAAEHAGPQMISGHSIDAELEFLQVTSGRGELPVSVGGNDKIWWRVPQQYSRQDIDIDGPATGVPGIGVLISPVWEAEDANWIDRLEDNLRSLSGRFLEFDSFKIQQSPPSSVNLGGQIGEVRIAHFYSVITLHTNATHRNFTADELGVSGNDTHFSHETSANFKQDGDPRLWASYSRREYSADPKMLALIRNGVEANGSVPGLALVQQDDGDGGLPTYRVAFKARVQPWGGDANTRFKAGFVHVDVVAARHGIGSIDAQDPQAPTGFCKIVPCFGGSSKINLNNAPGDYGVAPAVASVATGEGALQLFSGETLRAEREGAANDSTVDLPATARFALTTTMRSGALVRRKKKFFGGYKPLEIIPVNSYAQFVIKYTVAMVPEEIIVVGDEQIVPDPERLVETEAATPKDDKTWWEQLQENLMSLALPWLILIGVVALAIFVPGFVVFVNAVFKLLAAIVNAIARLFK